MDYTVELYGNTYSASCLCQPFVEKIYQIWWNIQTKGYSVQGMPLRLPNRKFSIAWRITIIWPWYMTLTLKSHWQLHCVSKKVPTFELSVTLSKLNQFSKICTAGKCMKFATKVIGYCPLHLRDVATLPWEIKNSNFLQVFSRYGRKCKQVAFLSLLAMLLIQKF